MKPGRIHPGEWLIGLAGLILLAGLIFLPWNGDESALASPGLLDILLLLIAAAAVLVPVIVASSSRTNVPMITETLLWTVSLLFGLILLFRAAFPPEGGFEAGFWLVLAATLALGFTLWRSVAREH